MRRVDTASLRCLQSVHAPAAPTALETEFRFGDSHAPWTPAVLLALQPTMAGRWVQSWTVSTWTQTREGDTRRRQFRAVANPVDALPTHILQVRAVASQGGPVVANECIKKHTVCRLNHFPTTNVHLVLSHETPVSESDATPSTDAGDIAVRYSGRTFAGKVELTAWFPSVEALLPQKLLLEYEVDNLNRIHRDEPLLTYLCAEVNASRIWQTLRAHPTSVLRRSSQCDVFDAPPGTRIGKCVWTVKTDGVRAMCVTTAIFPLDRTGRPMFDNGIRVFHPSGFLLHETHSGAWVHAWQNVCTYALTPHALYERDVDKLCEAETPGFSFTVFDGEWLPATRRFVAFDVLAVSGRPVRKSATYLDKLAFLAVFAVESHFAVKRAYQTPGDALLALATTLPNDGLICVDRLQKHWKLKDGAHGTFDVWVAPLPGACDDAMMVLYALHEDRRSLVPFDTWSCPEDQRTWVHTGRVYEFHLDRRRMVRVRPLKVLPNLLTLSYRINRTQSLEQTVAGLMASAPLPSKRAFQSEAPVLC